MFGAFFSSHSKSRIDLFQVRLISLLAYPSVDACWEKITGIKTMNPLPELQSYHKYW